MVKTHGFEPAGQLLIALHDQLHQVLLTDRYASQDWIRSKYLGEVPVLIIEEGGGQTKVTHSTSPTNSTEFFLLQESITWLFRNKGINYCM